MPRSLSPDLRESIRQRLLSGLPAPRIAADLGVGTRTVERFQARLRLQPPDRPLADGYGRCGRTLVAARLPVRLACAELRRLHPGWGAARIRLGLKGRFPAAAVPPARTLQSWLARDCPAPAAPPSHHAADYRRASEPHHVWQMDAVEKLRLLDGTQASWLRMTDECSGAIVWTSLFPRGPFALVTAAEVQEALRSAFARWGCPGRLRVDNGHPWGATGGLPTALCLWAAGLGVPLLYNPPRRPWRNGVVERSQRTSQRWAEPPRCADFAELARRVAEEDVNQRDRYPAVGGKSRREAHPGLAHTGRGYCRRWEAMFWDRKEALACLAGRVVARKVGRQGKVSLYDRMISVGREHAGQVLVVRFDSATEQWVFRRPGGEEVRRREAIGLSEEALVALTATGRPRQQDAGLEPNRSAEE